ncbi:DNA methyltransferase [Sediminivirga luteola]|uniref:DNA methyltransferase n=1 Tax=Actinomycetes TaxID=1760 RepID=UPI001F5A33C1|nr:DNA methyltransferase [Sediminivirga luteola]MCI2265653.1 site-specific DNA-methyltransferase [Sediminivirga luteola]
MRHWGVRRVLDPFGGSGTTSLVAQEQKVESVATEVHPMVARIANAKLLWTE